LAVAAWAGEPLVTDRPDFTESAVAVDPGRFQLEFGATWFDADGDELVTLPDALLRIGVSDRWELRFDPGSWLEIDRPRRDDVSGLTNAVLGFKVELVQGIDDVLGGMDLALIAATTVPTGDDDLVSDRWQPEIVLSAAWDLTGRLSVGSNLGVARLDDGGEWFTSAWITGVVGVAIDDRWGTFFELFLFNAERDDGPETLTFQTGATYLVSDDLQFDVRVARRLSSEGPDLLVGVGGAWRFGRGR
jgi:hypothetical protein